MLKYVNIFRKAEWVQAQHGRKVWICTINAHFTIHAKHMLIFTLGRFNNQELDIVFDCLIKDLINRITLTGSSAAGDKNMGGQRLQCQRNICTLLMIHMEHFSQMQTCIIFLLSIGHNISSEFGTFKYWESGNRFCREIQ